MRPLLLIIFTVGMFIGLPRLADKFRDDRTAAAYAPVVGPAVEASRDGQSKAGGVPAVSSAAANSSAQSPVSGQPIQVAVRAAEVPLSPKTAPAVTAAHPLDEDELIPAIQKELTRLGYYDGPITPRWNRAVRAAVREFGGVRRPRPTQRLLSALQAAQPAKRSEGRQQDQALKGETTDPVRPLPNYDRVVKVPASERQTVAQNDGYLPPWQAGSPRSAENVAIPRDRAENQASESSARLSEAARVSSHRRHRTVRAAKERRYLVSYTEPRVVLRRTAYRTAGFFWPDL